jgi:hypothetical protein
MDHNLLLEWMSERGSGTWQQFRDAHAWLETSSGNSTGEVPPGRTLEHLARLGHVEVSRGESRWAVTEPVITIVPGASVHAVVVGARTRAYLKHLIARIESTQHLDLVQRKQLEGPDALYVSCSDETVLVRMAAEVGAKYEYSVGERLSQLLPQLATLLETAAAPPPSVGFGVGRWDPDSNRFVPSETTGLAGLYRYEVYGAAEYRYSGGANRYSNVDFSTGKFAELNRLGRHMLQYETEEINGTLAVPVRADLPALQARAAILCSGLLPEFDRGSLSRLYRNVPRVIADRIAASLSQRLQVEAHAHVN